MSTKPVLFTRLASVTALAALAVLVGSGPAVANHRAGSDGVAVESAAARQVLYVSRHGSDSSPGTKQHPFATLSRAVSVAADGATIRVRGGVYHQSALVNKPDLKILGVGQRPVVFDGAARVSHFQQSGSVWVRHGWDVQFDRSPTFTRGRPDGTGPGQFVNPAYPLAPWPDQVWVDRHRLTQVSSASKVGPNDFAVDYAAHELILGRNPAGHNVQASRLAQAIAIRAPGVEVSRLMVRHYADSVATLGAVTAERSNILLSHMRIVGNATSGLVVTGDHVHIVRSNISRNGLIGIHGTEAYHLVLRHDRVDRNNLQHFNMIPVAGGIKMTSSRDVRIANSSFVGNLGTGIWMDSSSYGITVVNNRIRHNASHGVNLEISDTAVVANNLVIGNAASGVQANNTGNVSIWNNDLIHNTMPISIVQDLRTPTSQPSGRDTRRPFPDPTVPWIVRNELVSNNVISEGRAGSWCMLCVRDATHRRTGQQMVHADGNAYHRLRPSSPSGLVVWSYGPTGSRTFPDLATFRSQIGQEAHGRLTRAKLVTRSGRPVKRFRQIAPHVSRPLPAAVARAIAHTPGISHLGVFWMDF